MNIETPGPAPTRIEPRAARRDQTAPRDGERFEDSLEQALGDEAKHVALEDETRPMQNRFLRPEGRAKKQGGGEEASDVAREADPTKIGARSRVADGAPIFMFVQRARIAGGLAHPSSIRRRSTRARPHHASSPRLNLQHASKGSERAPAEARSGALADVERAQGEKKSALKKSRDSPAEGRAILASSEPPAPSIERGVSEGADRTQAARARAPIVEAPAPAAAPAPPSVGAERGARFESGAAARGSGAASVRVAAAAAGGTVEFSALDRAGRPMTVRLEIHEASARCVVASADVVTTQAVEHIIETVRAALHEAGVELREHATERREPRGGRGEREPGAGERPGGEGGEEQERAGELVIEGLIHRVA